MAWVFKQGVTASDNTGTATTIAATWPGVVGAGHLLVVFANVGTGGTAFTDATCADSGRETWTKVPGSFLTETFSGIESIVAFWVPNCVGGSANAVTVTFTGGTATASVLGIALMEYDPGAGTVVRIDGVQGHLATSSTTSDSTGTVPVNSAGELVVAGLSFYNDVGMTWTADTGHGFAWREQNDIATLEVQDNLSVSAGVSVLFTWSAAHGSFVDLGVSFVATASGAASPVRAFVVPQRALSRFNRLKPFWSPQRFATPSVATGTSIALTAAITASAAVAGTNTEAVAVSSAISPSVAVAGTNTEAVAVSGSISPSAVIAGTNRETVALTAPLTASVAVASTNAEATALSAPLTASAAVTSTDTKAVAASGAITASAAIVGTNTEQAALAGALSASAVVGTSSNTEAVALSAAISASAAVATAGGALTGTITASAAVSGTNREAVALSASLAASSAIVGVNLQTASLSAALAGMALVAGAETTTGLGPSGAVGEPTIVSGFAGRSKTAIGGRTGASVQGKDSVSGFSGRDLSSTGGRSKAGGN